jgi:predicted dehydrogenase
MRKITLGIIGSGGTAHHRIETFSKQEGSQVVAVSSRNSVTGTALAQQYGVEFVASLDDLLSRSHIDAVVICTHNESHGEISIKAIKAGKHVFLEYPLAREIRQGEQAIALARDKGLVLRLTHPERVSSMHHTLKREARTLGRLMTAIFVRLTPGRGARPEILFNLPVSGPPALFFIYHVCPVVDLFGPAVWVEGGANYEGLMESGQYRRFVNTVTVGFKDGGLGQWTWAGGIEIREAEEYQRFVLTEGTLLRENGRWYRSTRQGSEEVRPLQELTVSLEEVFLDEVRRESTEWLSDAQVALEAIRVSLGAELSMKEHRRVSL